MFDGIIERVGALVSRVQETYEFEVQPLREYFAAKHLYETSPYPSYNGEVSGDKVDRFRALVSNPYWLNVARFYGGCFNKGEILTLVQELIGISEGENLRFTSQPRGVAMMLLSDWVFSQYQPAVKQVLAFITKYPEFRQLLANAEHGASIWSGLPDRSGRHELLDVLWDRLVQSRHQDEQFALANAIAANSSKDEVVAKWLALGSVPAEIDWLRVGNMLNVYSHLKLNQIGESLSYLTEYGIRLVVAAMRFDLISNKEDEGLARQAILYYNPVPIYHSNLVPSNSLEWLAAITGIYQYGLALNDESGLPLHEVIRRQWEDLHHYLTIA
jgi:hypothetical protein